MVDEEDILNGTGTPHRKVSIKIHSTGHPPLASLAVKLVHNNEPNGNEDRSAIVGKRSEPITASSSRCAFFCASGYETIARINSETVVIVYLG